MFEVEKRLIETKKKLKIFVFFYPAKMASFRKGDGDVYENVRLDGRLN